MERARAACLATVVFLLQSGANISLAAPVTYTFSTLPNPFGGPSVAGGPFPDPNLFFGGVSGTFVYDSSALIATTGSDGSTIYRGFAPQSTTGFVTATSNLTGTVAGHNVGDVSGTAQVGNDTSLGAGGSAKTDIFQLSFDPGLGSTSARNFTGFDIAGFTLMNLRMFWIEGQATPEPIADFLTDQSLLAGPPSFHGRLALDFVPSTSPSGPQSFVFFDGLTVTAARTVPEPSSCGMLLLGLLFLWGFRKTSASTLESGSSAPA